MTYTHKISEVHTGHVKEVHIVPTKMYSVPPSTQVHTTKYNKYTPNIYSVYTKYTKYTPSKIKKQ